MSVNNYPVAAERFTYTTQSSVASGYEREAQQYTHPYAKRRYQFTLTRILFHGLTWLNPRTGEQEQLLFYKDGTISAEGITSPDLLALATTTWCPDYNMAFWQIRRAALSLRERDPAYDFTYDAGLTDLLTFVPGC